VGDPTLALELGVDLIVFGSGAREHESKLRGAGYSGPIGRASTSVAAAAGRIALATLATGTAAPGELAPLYVRPSDAEVRFR
jgi:hypothetical protein